MKTILIALVGATPQIVTETLYALLVAQETPYRLEEIHIITTSLGRDKCKEMLEDYGNGAYYRFCRDYRIEPASMKLNTHVVADRHISELSDIRSIPENEDAANFITRFIRDQASDPETRILASLAGGRKTMSTYMGFAMQLFGRRQDRLFHVLLQPPVLENNPGFFYPPPQGKDVLLKNRAGKAFRVPGADIRIDLAEIPFIHLREHVPPSFRDELLDFTDIVKNTQQVIDEAEYIPRMIVDMKSKTIEVSVREKSYEIVFAPREMALYCYLAQNGELINAVHQQETLAPQIFDIYKTHYPYLGKSAKMFYAENLQQIRGKLNRKISSVIDRPLVNGYLTIQSDMDRYEPRYAISIPLKNITILTGK